MKVNPAESRYLRMFCPWLAQLRGLVSSVPTELKDRYTQLLQGLETQMLLRHRYHLELGEADDTARLDLKYARFALQAAIEEGLYIDSPASYLVFCKQASQTPTKISGLDELDDLGRQLDFPILLESLAAARKSFANKDETLAVLRSSLGAKRAAAKETSRGLNNARISRGLPSENTSRLDDSAAAEG
jgi:hypothetical protein